MSGDNGASARWRKAHPAAYKRGMRLSNWKTQGVQMAAE